MPTLTAPASNQQAKNSRDQPINLFQLDALFVIRVSYWPCRAGNEPAELDLTQDSINRQVIATYGTKDLIDPQRGRKTFALLEAKARHSLAKVSQPFLYRTAAGGLPLASWSPSG